MFLAGKLRVYIFSGKITGFCFWWENYGFTFLAEKLRVYGFLAKKLRVYVFCGKIKSL